MNDSLGHRIVWLDVKQTSISLTESCGRPTGITRHILSAFVVDSSSPRVPSAHNVSLHTGRWNVPWTTPAFYLRYSLSLFRSLLWNPPPPFYSYSVYDRIHTQRCKRLTQKFPFSYSTPVGSLCSNQHTHVKYLLERFPRRYANVEDGRKRQEAPEGWKGERGGGGGGGLRGCLFGTIA